MGKFHGGGKLGKFGESSAINRYLATINNILTDLFSQIPFCPSLHPILPPKFSIMWYYYIVQNSGGVKLWQINRFTVLARKILANLQ